MLWELSHAVLETDLSHISSTGVVSGDPVDVHNLLEILSALLVSEDLLGSSAGTSHSLAHMQVLVFSAASTFVVRNPQIAVTSIELLVCRVPIII